MKIKLFKILFSITIVMLPVLCYYLGKGENLTATFKEIISVIPFLVPIIILLIFGITNNNIGLISFKKKGTKLLLFAFLGLPFVLLVNAFGKGKGRT
jgi:hypothetical protein